MQSSLVSGWQNTDRNMTEPMCLLHVSGEHVVIRLRNMLLQVIIEHNQMSNKKTPLK